MFNQYKSKPSQVVFEGVEVLVGLGLTARQARVYLALLRLGDATAKALTFFVSIERQEVYRLLGELERLGLVKRCLSVPTRFSAVSPAVGVELLIERKLDDLNRITGQAISLSKKLKEITPPNPAQPVLSFGMVMEAERGKRYLSALEAAQHRVQAVLGWMQFKQLCFLFEDALLDAIKRGAAVEVLTEQPRKHCLPPWIKAALVKYPNFKLKTVEEPLSAAMTVFDGAQAVVAFTSCSRLTKGPDLWTEHPALVAACQAYFWEKWDKC
jgi:sugar-specific transcriptional regulator TrmB